jgi:ABC-type multidrug transport system fused ATPase/permease subunit
MNEEEARRRIAAAHDRLAAAQEREAAAYARIEAAQKRMAVYGKVEWVAWVLIAAALAVAFWLLVEAP